VNRRTRNRLRQQELTILYATTRKRHARQKAVRWVLLVIVVLITLTGAAVGTHFAMKSFLDQALYQNPQYAIEKILIQTKGDYSQRQILRAAGIRKGDNIWTIDLAKIRENIERLPFVAEARLEKQLPSTLVVKIKERTPILQFRAYDSDLGTPELFYVDREACVLFKPRPGEANHRLPEVKNLKMGEFEIGQSLKNTEVGVAVELIKRLEISPLASRLDIKEIDLGAPLALKVTARDDSTIYFRLDFIGQQLQRLQEIYEYARIRDQRLASVDLTLDRNVPVRFLQ
jgi:cell division protein FtsQ